MGRWAIRRRRLMAKVKKSLLISSHDLREIEMFRQHLADKQTMPSERFYRKWRVYMGLSEQELEAILRAGDPPKEQKP
jgi:hypothetical protein